MSRLQRKKEVTSCVYLARNSEFSAARGDLAAAAIAQPGRRAQPAAASVV